MSHSASRTWVSAETKEYEAFIKVRENVCHVAPGSPFVPWTWPDWIAHRLAVGEDTRKEIIKKLTAKESQRAGTKRKIQPALAGRDFGDHLTCVLLEDSMWTKSITERPDRPQAPWPCQDELQHEGNHRCKSGFRRFYPLPRVPGNATVNWKQRAPVKLLPFDEVGCPKTGKEEEEHDVFDIDEEILMLIGYALVKEFDK
ncbi:hypothetical protein CPC735_049740 [Paecilomyces variotii No. 5]|uniref:Uncharacterized protein n=1 Tax=Byssochlamys spectabilis (strain No. 5 / NBRC 109023) TaxID=1356009 RepID=V5G5L7_BYSSN|nr:hypothetical protein CPC735_049740 [Paecilomyces variotii No. 5]